jgi:hypothetical protein
MADATIAIRAYNFFDLGSDFEAQSSLYTQNTSVVNAFGNTQLSVQSSSVEAPIILSTNYRYCGTNLSTGLGVTATSFGRAFNSLSLGWIATDNLAIRYTASGYPEVALRAHQHPSATHTSAVNTTDVSGLIPASGFGVPDFGVTTGSNCSPIAAELQMTKPHYDVADADGEHYYGMNSKGVIITLSMQFAGLPTDNTASAIETAIATTGFDLKVTSLENSDTNSQFSSFAFVANGTATA